MKKSALLIILWVSVVFVSILFGQSRVKRVGEIKYISKQTYYINLGTKQGLCVGDTVMVKQNGRLIGKLIVDNIARLSSSCSLIFQNRAIKQGDRVEILVQIKSEASEIEPSTSPKKIKPVRNSEAKPKYKGSSTRHKKRKANRVKGRVGIQSLLFNDFTNSKLNYHQLALHGKLNVEQFMNLPLELRIHWRSRAHHRESTLNSNISENEWTHQFFEMGLFYSNGNSPFEFGVGRILFRNISGLGYIDGGLFSIQMNNHLRIGLVGGTQPSLRKSGFQTDEQKFGIFLNFTRGDYQTQRFSSTVSFSGRYRSGDISREFIYLQNNFWKGTTLSIYQSVEVDLNRGWKRDFGNSRLEFSNFFLSAHYRPRDYLTLTLSYDARKNIRVFETRSIPDSLFDETTRQGVHAGFTLRLPNRMRLSGNLGIRFRKGGMKNTVSVSGILSARNLFGTWTSLYVRFSYFSTMFTRGYRPNITIRIPVLRDLSINLGGGSYIYQTGSSTTNSNWLQADSYFRINRWLFGSLGYRYFTDTRLKSGRLFLETGVVF